MPEPGGGARLGPPRRRREGTAGIVDNARMDTVPPDTAAPAQDGFLPLPEAGRVFTGGYPIRRTDITPGGRLRLAYRLTPGRADIWLLNETRRLASARVTRDPGEPGTGGSQAEGHRG
jgi:hypothetical protein